MKIGVVDVGNSLIKCGIIEDENVVEYKAFNFSDIDKINVFFTNVNEISYCSVVKEFDLKDVIKNKKLFELNYISSLIKLNYTKTLGSDRIAKAHYIAFKIKEMSIILDLGTATVIDLVSNEFIGGLILPGYKTWLKSLSYSTSKLPDLSESELNISEKLLGNSTEEAILIGLINSYKMVCLEIERKYNVKHKFITGGNVKKVLSYFNGYRYEPYLSLIGLYLWFINFKTH